MFKKLRVLPNTQMCIYCSSCIFVSWAFSISSRDSFFRIRCWRILPATFLTAQKNPQVMGAMLGVSWWCSCRYWSPPTTNLRHDNVQFPVILSTKISRQIPQIFHQSQVTASSRQTDSFPGGGGGYRSSSPRSFRDGGFRDGGFRDRDGGSQRGYREGNFRSNGYERHLKG